jgi:hypothetical protein
MLSVILLGFDYAAALDTGHRYTGKKDSENFIGTFDKF